MVQPSPGVDPVFVVYLLAFGAAAVACFASLTRVGEITDDDTRRGLAALLLTSGGWASAQVGFLLVPGVALKTASYLAGLIVGLATVGPWLYFCSAYTGRTLHRNPTYRRVAAAVFLAIVAVKVTNPIHGLYFTTEFVAVPFPHLAVEHGLIHWIVMGLSYGLAMVGYFMLFERFTKVSYDTRPLLVLVAITGLPVALDLIGLASPALLDITYEPIGVAAFAVGVFFVFLDRFQAVQVAGGREEPVVVLDDDDRIHEFNDRARERFGALDADAIGEPIWKVLPDVAGAFESDPPILEVDADGVTRYYRVSESPFAAGRTTLGRLLVLTDITERERYRRELERQNERLDQFASMVSHDLRNPLNVAEGRIDLARERRDDGDLEAAARALDRMGELIEDLLALARQGQPIEGTEAVSLSSVVERCWGFVDTADADLVVGDDLRFEADPDRLQQLLENLLRNAVQHGGPDVTIRVGALDRDGFYVEDDGPGIPENEREEVFESGYTTAESGTGFGLAIVAEIAEAHGWAVRAVEGSEGGARFEFTGVDRAG